MATIYDKYFKHIQKSDLIMMPEIRKRVMYLPVCPKCERPALRDTHKNDPERRFITCPVCGHHGPFTHTVGVHVKEHVPVNY